MNGLRAVKALTDSRGKSKKIIRQGADKDGCQENAIICIAVGELAYWNEVMNDDVSLIISEPDDYANARVTDNIEEEIRC